MSVAASDCVMTDEELEDLGEDGISVVTYESETEKKPKKKKTSHKPPRSPKSPYLSNTYLQPKKAAVWRSLKGTGTMHVENPSSRVPRELWLASLKSGLALTQPLKAEYDFTQARLASTTGTPEYLKEALGMKKPKHSRSSSNGYVPGTPDYKEKEDMYDEIIELKKMLQTQKSEADIMKTKLRRLEEDNSKKEKQIEQLLDPSKGSEFTRSLVDKKKDSSVITNGLKQKILKLEQQCKEKDHTINKLQTDLKTTNTEEMKIAMETYYEEIQRLRIMLANMESAEKKSESKEAQKQQKVLNSTILRLSKNIKQMQEENKCLKEDLARAMDSPSASARGYNDWSKPRLVRRITELERLKSNSQKVDEVEMDSSNQASSARLTVALVSTSADQSNQTASSTLKGLEPQQECERLRGLVKKLKEDRTDLQKQLAGKLTEIKLLSGEKEELTKEVQRLKSVGNEKSFSEAKEKIEKLTQKVKRLEAELEDERRIKEDSLHTSNKSQRRASSSQDTGCRSHVSPEQDQGNTRSQPSSARSEQHQKQKQDKAARTIQKYWHQHKDKNESEGSDEDTVVIQSALRGHLTRQKQLTSLKDLEEHKPFKSQHAVRSSSAHSLSPADEDGDEAVTLLQSAFRGHLARSGQLSSRSSDSNVVHGSGRNSPRKSPVSSRKQSIVPSPAPRSRPTQTPCKNPTGSGLLKAAAISDDEEIEEDLTVVTGDEDEEELETKGLKMHATPSNRRLSPAQSSQSQSKAILVQPSKDDDSEDSDDIIVSPSRPVRRKDSYF
ncbi:IQ domain-containing protein E [Polyodon spathula]|uniref:IQ domain-containing protein E n=1 Tax=Polyodon spathula TaxID=7913 RepID=UPI001B7DE675|nr:IQ domain-containing protein E [Polyodon spathula]